MSPERREERFVAYTDGGCHPNPGRGGWGAVLLQKGRVVRELSGDEESSTNNRMELQAAVEALTVLQEDCHVELHTDSKYLRDGMTKWLVTWRRNQWRTKAGEPVKSRDLWQRLAEPLRPDIEWVATGGVAPPALMERARQVAKLAQQEAGPSQ